MTTNEKVIEHMVLNNCTTAQAINAVIGEGAFESLAAQVWNSINAKHAVNRLLKGWPA